MLLPSRAAIHVFKLAKRAKNTNHLVQDGKKSKEQLHQSNKSTISLTGQNIGLVYNSTDYIRTRTRSAASVSASFIILGILNNSFYRSLGID